MLLLLKSATSGGAAASYPLDDDGTLAAAFGFGWLETDAPAYNNADYTYLAPATGNSAIALPTAANAWTSQAHAVRRVGAGDVKDKKPPRWQPGVRTPGGQGPSKAVRQPTTRWMTPPAGGVALQLRSARKAPWRGCRGWSK